MQTMVNETGKVRVHSEPSFGGTHHAVLLLEDLFCSNTIHFEGDYP